MFFKNFQMFLEKLLNVFAKTSKCFSKNFEMFFEDFGVPALGD
jgi:hypothetical protein